MFCHSTKLIRILLEKVRYFSHERWGWSFTYYSTNALVEILIHFTTFLEKISISRFSCHIGCAFKLKFKLAFVSIYSHWLV